MKIGLVCPYDIYKGGGVQEYVRATGKELSSRGHTVRIITPLPREAAEDVPEDVIFIGRSRDIKSPLHTTSQISVSLNGDMVEEVLRKENFDILHFHEPWVPIVSRQILSRSTSKNVATFHAKLPETMMSKTIERVITPYTRSILKDLDALTAVSEAGASYVRSLTEQEVVIIPDAIDLVKYQKSEAGSLKSGIQTSKFKLQNLKVILYIGRLEKRKGVKYLLKAFASMNKTHPGTKLLIAGDGDDRVKLEQQAENLGISDDVSFLGYISDKEKTRLLHMADLFCSPALYGESFGIVLLEAMAVGLPVVAGDNPGYAGVMAGRGKLSLVDPKDTDEFSRRLELLLTDTELRELWRTWAAEHIRQFAYPKVVDKYEALYKRVLKA